MNKKRDLFISDLFSKYYGKSNIVLVDVGASGSLPDNWKNVKRNLTVVAFEPDERAALELSGEKKGGIKLKLIDKVLYREKGKLEFNLARKQRLSSVFKPNFDFLNAFPRTNKFDTVKTVSVDCDTLDNQLRENGIDDIDFIKLDTQGCDLFILEGGAEVLKKSCFGIEVEAEFASVYRGQPLFADVDAFVRSLGFELFDIRPYYWKRKKGMRVGGVKGQIIRGDALYFKNSGIFFNQIKLIGNEIEKKTKILKAITASFVYGYADYAIELLESSPSGLFDEKEKDEFREVIEEQYSNLSLIPNFLKSRKLSNYFLNLYNTFKPIHRDWKSKKSSLGNL